MECGERLQPNKEVHYTCCITVVRAKVELAHGGIIKLLVSQFDTFLHDGVLDTHGFGEITEDFGIRQVEFG